MSVRSVNPMNICVVNTFEGQWLVSCPGDVELFVDRDSMLAAVRRRVTQTIVAGGRCTVSHSDKNDQWSDITAFVAQ